MEAGIQDMVLRWLSLFISRREGLRGNLTVTFSYLLVGYIKGRARFFLQVHKDRMRTNECNMRNLSDIQKSFCHSILNTGTRTLKISWISCRFSELNWTRPWAAAPVWACFQWELNQRSPEVSSKLYYSDLWSSNDATNDDFKNTLQGPYSQVLLFSTLLTPLQLPQRFSAYYSVVSLPFAPLKRLLAH